MKKLLMGIVGATMLLAVGACSSSDDSLLPIPEQAPSNPFISHYHPVDVSNNLVTPPDGTPPAMVEGSNSIKADKRKAVEDGYGMIGYSAFSTTKAHPLDLSLLRQQAEYVGASLVIYYVINEGSRSIMMPETTHYHGTIYMPIMVNDYEYGVSYWQKVRSYVFGAVFSDLTDQQRQMIGSNRGCAISIVVNGTPAFNSDFIAGDVLTAMNGQRMTSTKDCNQAIDALSGRTVEITYWRNGTESQKTVTLN
jgi:hypothetical protein